MSPSITALNGCFSFHSGCCGASALMRSKVKACGKYIGCSAHRVPSLSKVAMRSGTGTKVRRAFPGHLFDEGDDGLLRCRVIPGWQRIGGKGRVREQQQNEQALGK